MMDLNRRSFLLGSIALTASLAAPEVIPFNRKWFFPFNLNVFKNLWTPEITLGFPLRHYSVAIPFTAEDLGVITEPKNQLLSISYITKEALQILEKELPFAKHINRVYDEMAYKGTKGIGYMLDIKTPARFVYEE